MQIKRFSKFFNRKNIQICICPFSYVVSACLKAKLYLIRLLKCFSKHIFGIGKPNKLMNNPQHNIILGIDIGGSHISAALVDISSCTIKEGTFTRERVNSKGTANEILASWQNGIQDCLKAGKHSGDVKIAIAMPGPFDYENGISFITGLDKYEALYGINVKEYLSKQLSISAANIRFRNDAEAFLAGEIRANRYNTSVKTLGITLGTGLGSALSSEGTTHDANFAITPFHGTIAEEYLSTRWFVSRFAELTGQTVKDVKEMLGQTQYDREVQLIFKEFTENLSQFLCTIMEQEHFKTLIIGGNITKTADKFLPKVLENLRQLDQNVEINLANLGEASAIIGASLLFNQTIN